MCLRWPVSLLVVDGPEWPVATAGCSPRFVCAGYSAEQPLFAPSISTWLDLGNNFSLQNNVGIEHGFTSNTDALFWGGALIYSMYTDGSPRITNGSGRVRGHFPKGMLSPIAEIGGELSLDGDDEVKGAAEWLFGVSYAISSKVKIRGALSCPAWNPRDFDNGATIDFLDHFRTGLSDSMRF